MKKYLISFVILCGLSMTAFAQTEDKPAGEKPSPEFEALATAHSLAKYGYANYSASALIGAAEILSQIPTRKLEVEKAEEGAKVDNKGAKTEKPEFTPAQLLADAKKYAAGDATMLAWADKVEKAIAANATRGATGGPSCISRRVYAGQTNTYTCRFRGGETACITVSGDGDTDLDLYVYDSNGKLVDSDDDYSDDCLALWKPPYTQTYTIKVKNRGNVYNNFTLCTN